MSSPAPAAVDDDGVSTSVSQEGATDTLFSDTQEVILGATGVVVGLLSALGSLWIIYRIVVVTKSHQKQVYPRLMLGLSSLDFVSGLGHLVFGNWAMPVESGISGAKGSFTTCEIAGYIINFGTGTVCYSAFLSVYFCLRILPRACLCVGGQQRAVRS